MKTEKSELSKKLNQLKNIVPRMTSFEATKGVLFENGYLIASNRKMSVRAKIGYSDATPEPFVIPEKAIGVINSLPNGEVELTNNESVIRLKCGNIKNEFRTIPAEQFVYPKQTENPESGTIPASEFKEALLKTLYAVAPDGEGTNRLMTGLNMSCSNGKLDFCGLDGKRIAWTQAACFGTFDIIVPRETLDNILKLDISDNSTIIISVKKNSVVFITDEYEIFSTLIDGKYFDYKKMLTNGAVQILIDRKALLEATNRIKLLELSGDKTPVILKMHDDEIDIVYKNSDSEYSESITSNTKLDSPLRIGVNPKLLSDALKMCSDDKIEMELTSEKQPMLIKSGNGTAKALVLPINLAKEG